MERQKAEGRGPSVTGPSDSLSKSDNKVIGNRAENLKDEQLLLVIFTCSTL
jgi:hypothetical protein